MKYSKNCGCKKKKKRKKRPQIERDFLNPKPLHLSGWQCDSEISYHIVVSSLRSRSHFGEGRGGRDGRKERGRQRWGLLGIDGKLGGFLHQLNYTTALAFILTIFFVHFKLHKYYFYCPLLSWFLVVLRNLGYNLLPSFPADVFKGLDRLQIL